MKYKFWAILNKEGKELYGDIFPNSIVPIKDVLMPQKAKLTDNDGQTVFVEKVYRIDWKLLTEKQREECVKIVAEKNKILDCIIKSEFERLGFIPLREKYTCGSGTTETRLFM